MNKQVQDAYVVGALRTPVGKAPRGMFKTTRPDDLLAHAIRGLLTQFPQLDPRVIGDVIVGCAIPEAEQGMNVARIALLLAGLPESVSGMTVNRFCASGLQAVSMAADRIRLGEADLMLAAGTESMSLVPMMGNKVAFNPRIFTDNEHIGIAYGMGATAEKVAARWKVGREAQDEFAFESHRRALAAIQRGEFKDEILPYEITSYAPDPHGSQIQVRRRVVAIDEGPRADNTREALAALRPVFAARGSVTAGNSSQISDGAAAILLASERGLRLLEAVPMARFLGYAVVGVAPEIMGIGPIEAILKALKLIGMKQDDLDWIELNEAFAAQSLVVISELGLDRARTNPLGGAIALGHPLGATGAIRTATLTHALKRHRLKYGMVTMCVGTGMGAAGVFEAVT
ncbi:MAG: acetyl-CoA C-acyltransferase [Pseudomonadota bacterium]|nr:acetyl-CoA C-acyltransferase [Pseudomonadota bacterium]